MDSLMEIDVVVPRKLPSAKFSSLRAVDEMDYIRRNRRILASNNTENVQNMAKGGKEVTKNMGFTLRKPSSLVKNNSKIQAPPVVEKPSVCAPETKVPQVASISEYSTSRLSSSSLSPECFDDQHNYLLFLERTRGMSANFLVQKHITGKMRYVLFDWMLQVQERFTLQHDTLQLAYIVVDRCLQRMDIKKDKLQLLGSTCLFLAAKYEEVTLPHIQDFVYLSASAFGVRDITHMEREIFRIINFNLGYAYPLQFLRRYRYVLQNDDVTHPLSKMLCDLFMAVYELGHKMPSVMAQVSLYIAYFVTGKELPSNVYPFMGTTPTVLKKECSDYIDHIISFCTSLKDLTLHRRYVRTEVNPRLSKEQLERLKTLKAF